MNRRRRGSSGGLSGLVIVALILPVLWILFQDQISIIFSCFGLFFFLALLNWLGGMGTAIKRKKN